MSPTRVVLLIFGFVVVSYSLLYILWLVKDITSIASRESQKTQPPETLNIYVPDNSSSVLVAQIEELQHQVQYLQKKLIYEQWKTIRLQSLVEPWERCMRFSYRRNCQPGSGGPDDPPCNADILREMLFSLIDAMESSQIPHWVSYGTLLGAIRQNAILPWTADADIVVPGEEFAGISNKIKRVLEKNGYMFFPDKTYPNLGRVCMIETATKYRKWEKMEPEKDYYYDAYPYVDIYQIVSAGDDKLAVKHGPACIFRKSTIYPLVRTAIENKPVWAPANSTTYLRQLYGPDFMQIPPQDKQHPHGAYSMACKPEWQY